MELSTRMRRKDRYYMSLAMEVAKASKCLRAQFGSVIVSADDRVVGTGYNGKPRGSTCDHVCFREGLPPNSPGRLCCGHSESHALLFSSPLDRKDGTIYVTGQPCSACSLAILQSGIKRLVYFVVQDGSHPGWTGPDVFAEYGCPIEVVPFYWEEDSNGSEVCNDSCPDRVCGGRQRSFGSESCSSG